MSDEQTGQSTSRKITKEDLDEFCHKLDEAILVTIRDSRRSHSLDRLVVFILAITIITILVIPFFTVCNFR